MGAFRGLVTPNWLPLPDCCDVVEDGLVVPVLTGVPDGLGVMLEVLRPPVPESALVPLAFAAVPPFAPPDVVLAVPRPAGVLPVCEVLADPFAPVCVVLEIPGAVDPLADEPPVVLLTPPAPEVDPDAVAPPMPPVPPDAPPLDAPPAPALPPPDAPLPAPPPPPAPPA
jgi:hypothetical protein